MKSARSVTGTDREVKLLRLLLISPSLGQARLAEIGFTESGLDRLHAVAVVEALGDIVVLHCHHVLDGGQSGLHGFLHLKGSKEEKTRSRYKTEAVINTKDTWRGLEERKQKDV